MPHKEISGPAWATGIPSGFCAAEAKQNSSVWLEHRKDKVAAAHGKSLQYAATPSKSNAQLKQVAVSLNRGTPI